MQASAWRGGENRENGKVFAAGLSHWRVRGKWQWIGLSRFSFLFGPRKHRVFLLFGFPRPVPMHRLVRGQG